MSGTTQPDRPALEAGRRRVIWAGALVFVAAWAVYFNSLWAPFIFDDSSAVINNPTIRKLWSWDVLSPPGEGNGVQSRPLINLTLALNHALGGAEPWGYHLFNVLVHAAAGLVLFGLVRRTLLQAPLAARWGAASLPLALTIALLWTVHPLQTESVTLVVQRTESLMGFFYLLTLYAFVRGVETGAAHPRRWQALAVFFCLLGMASKEVMVSAPLIVLLYDRTFVAGTFRGAWESRRPLYLGLAATWLLLAWLVWTSGGQRGVAAGFGLGITPWTYALTQCRAIVHYLRLVFWPHPLILDYGSPVVQNPLDVAPQALLLLLLAGGTLVALRRRTAAGFAGAWFFLILAPSSSVLPLVAQTIAEHRMYLPLAAVLAVVVTSLHRWLGQRCLYLCAAVAVGFGGLTVRRNHDYRSALAIYEETVRQNPWNSRAYSNYCHHLVRAGRVREAIAGYELLLRTLPRSAKIHYSLANALARTTGRTDDAETHFRAAIKLQPDSALAYDGFGRFLAQTGRLTEAIATYQRALQLDANYAEAHANLGAALLLDNRPAEAKIHLETALRLNPALTDARDNLAKLASPR